MFGRGIVETADNFGSTGSGPTHPDLLDWLAHRFVASGWDRKALHRLIVLSATYRQSSEAGPELRARDPENRLLARGPRHRLSAEQIRDSALAASGLLASRIGGPSVKPYQPAGLWEESGTNKTYAADKGEGLYRRSLYTFWRRTSPPPSMLAFDAPSREVCTARREATQTPLQALVLLNDPSFVEASRAFLPPSTTVSSLLPAMVAPQLSSSSPASSSVVVSQCPSKSASSPQNILFPRLARGGRPNVDGRIEGAFRLLLARRPDERERDVLRRLYSEQLAYFSGHPEAAERYLAVGEHARAGALGAADVAATAVLVSALMNQGEFVMKR